MSGINDPDAPILLAQVGVSSTCATCGTELEGVGHRCRCCLLRALGRHDLCGCDREVQP